MITVESDVITQVEASLQTDYPNIAISSVLELNPSEFPFVSIEEADNYSRVETASTTTSENHANVVYEVNVFVNQVQGKKAEARKIFTIIDNKMNSLGFIRTSSQFIGFDDGTKYRMFGRYKGIVSSDYKIYR